MTNLDWEIGATQWTIGGVDDRDGDDWNDILWHRLSNGGVASCLMTGVDVAAPTAMQGNTSLDWKLSGLGDINHDGKADLLWRNQVSGENAVWFLDGPTVSGAGLLPSESDLDVVLAGPR